MKMSLILHCMVLVGLKTVSVMHFHKLPGWYRAAQEVITFLRVTKHLLPVIPPGQFIIYRV